ncbi:MAG: GIY-YIG nuclease family protein [Candidatus Omnitrophota bacterium]
MMNDIWFVYIVECRTKELYVGISKDVEERIKEHNRGGACRYTRFRKPVKLLYKEPNESYSCARARERQIKKFSRRKKLLLIDKK